MKPWRDSSRLWQIAFLATFALAAIYTYLRVEGVNPAILGDEWVYLVSSRHHDFWSPESAALGNFLFNFVYGSTMLCGDAFYQCAKGLNLVFFSVFSISLTLTLKGYANQWVALATGLAIFASPLSVYVSMYLPESLFFAMIGLAVFMLSRALRTNGASDWVLVGSFLGLAALTKPHALLSAMGVGLALAIFAIFKSGSFMERTKPLFLVTVSAVVVRFALGFVLGGPAALSLLSSYNSGEALATLTNNQPATEPGGDSIVGGGQVAGAFGLFPDQFVIHLLSIFAIAGIAITVIVARFLNRVRRDESLPVDRLALVVLIWLGTMVVSIVLFTGWITGGGDDHTLRVLLRYYDFLLPILFVVAIALASQRRLDSSSLLSRWIPSAAALGASAVAFTGFFSTLVIQIADAPFLAGLVVDRFVYDSVSVIGFLAILVLAFFPRHLLWALLASLIFTFPAMGFISQSQYISFRGEDNGADQMGKYAYANLSEQDREQTPVVAQSRFDGRTVSFWMDADNVLLLLPAGSVISRELFSDAPRFLIVDESMVLGEEYASLEQIGEYVLAVAKDVK